MSFYTVENPQNFTVNDPFSQALKSISDLKISVDALQTNSTNLSNLNLNFSTPFTYLNGDIGFIPNKTYLMSNDEETRATETTLILPPAGYDTLLFSTYSSKNVFNKYVNKGYWTTNLNYKTSSNNISIGVIHFAYSYYTAPIIISTNFLSNDEIVKAPFSPNDVNSIKIRSKVNNMEIPAGCLIVTEIFFINNSDNQSQNIQLFFGGDNNGFLQTTLNPLKLSSAMSWVCADPYYAFLNYKSFNGCMYAYGYDYGEITNTDYIQDLYGGAILLSQCNIFNTDLYNYFDNGNFNYVQIQNSYDPKNSFIASLDGWGGAYDTYNFSTVYKGFNYAYNRTYGSDPSINRLVIYSLSANGNTSQVSGFYADCNQYSMDSDNDYFDTYFYSDRPDVLIYTSVYGQNSEPLSLEYIDSYFRAFVDNIILVNGQQGVINSITDMQTNFTNNFNKLKTSLPSNFLYKDFVFINFGNQSQSSTSGSGINFSLSLYGGRKYLTFGINNAGSNYQVGDIITINGSNMGGVDGVNDATIIVTAVGGSNEVVSFNLTGNVAYLQNQTLIQDGGDDQYDGGNELNNNNDDTGNVTTISYGDGSVRNDIFGNGSQLIVDYNESIFAMFVTNASRCYDFYISGNLGADGDGVVDCGGSESMWYFDFYRTNYGSQGFIQPGQMYTVQLTTDVSNMTANNNLNLSPHDKTIKHVESVKKYQIEKAQKLQARKEELQTLAEKKPNKLTYKQKIDNLFPKNDIDIKAFSEQIKDKILTFLRGQNKSLEQHKLNIEKKLPRKSRR